MLLIVTIVLVLVAAVTLLIGIFTDNLALIFISIGASAVAAIVLAVLSQVSRRRDRSIGPPAQGRTPVSRPPTPPTAAERPAPGGYTPPTPAYQPPAPPAPRPAGRPAPARADEERTSVLPVATAPAPAADELPIARYDSLRVSQVLKQLEGLDLDQLEEVAQYEEANKNRTTVLDRIDDLMDELEAREAGGAAPEAPAVEPTEAEPPVAEPAEAERAEPAAVEPVPLEAAPSAAGGFPIPDYDSLDEDEIIDLLGDLDEDELEAVGDREEAGQNRASILDAIDDRLDVLEGLVPTPPPAPVVVPAAPAPKAASKSPAKRAAGKRTPAKKAVRAKKAAPAKEAAPARKAAKKATPVKKAAAARAAKAPAKKAAPATVAKAPARKATKTAATKSATKAAKKGVGTAKASKRSAKKA